MREKNNYFKEIENHSTETHLTRACRIRPEVNDKRKHIIEMKKFQKFNQIVKLILLKRKKISGSDKNKIIDLLDNLKLDEIIELLNIL